MILTLAWRNIGRNRRRTFLTVSAMVVSSSLLILSLSLFSGMFSDMLASATEQYYGHVVVTADGYQQEREMFINFAPEDDFLNTLDQAPQTLGVSPRLRAFGLFSHADNSYPAELLGVDPQREEQVTTLGRMLSGGHYLLPGEFAGVVLGAVLADKLGVNPGDELVFVTQAADGSIGNALLTVSGVFRTGATGQDNTLALVSLPWLQKVMALPGRVHEIAITVTAPLEAPLLAREMAAQLPPGLEVHEWSTLLPEMREVLASYAVSRLIMALILYSAAGLGVLNTFFMAVMERTREFGILMAMGLRPMQVRLLVMTETLAMGLLSLLIGLITGGLLTLYMSRVGIDLSGYLTPITYAGGTILPRLRAEFAFDNFWIPSLCLLLICLLAGLLPANRAARLEPVRAIREE
ncbi:MAG: FtsX-like permease family protein [Desulfuromonadales bacterium]|nr:FtsX-like permease family protein [Desulfuromonadales bacterium]MDT8422693.1 FtsX-like permease family protein [Desulfuromonadales bacterium]